MCDVWHPGIEVHSVGLVEQWGVAVWFCLPAGQEAEVIPDEAIEKAINQFYNRGGDRLAFVEDTGPTQMSALKWSMGEVLSAALPVLRAEWEREAVARIEDREVIGAKRRTSVAFNDGLFAAIRAVQNGGDQ